MKFCDDTKPLYLETNASGVGLGAALLQLCDNTICQRNMVPDNTILHPIAFASKSLTGAEQTYSNMGERGTWHITWLGKVSSLLFWQRGTHHHQLQTAGINI